MGGGPCYRIWRWRSTWSEARIDGFAAEYSPGYAIYRDMQFLNPTNPGMGSGEYHPKNSRFGGVSGGRFLGWYPPRAQPRICPIYEIAYLGKLHIRVNTRNI